jgi:hypothetical protein
MFGLAKTRPYFYVIIKNTTIMINITQLEDQVLEALIDGLYAEPHFSDVDVNDIAQTLKMSTKTIRGVLGSLSKKNIISIDDNGAGYEIIYLNEHHWYLHPTWCSEKEWLNEEKVIKLKHL